MVHPKIIQKTTAIEDMIYAAYILAYKMHVILAISFYLGNH